ncbi:serine hydrolase [Thiocapsa bogorovii]|uniref:serine hydrolase n=1 Tax=Thiocapsa bogorovii TaxID=521689 RepID=UPI001E3E875B|nr:serine hydrolase [Thiocapsa bogorovii]UHD15433.1 class A beta-lactamase-related serine hydrolase [Thiocapsa bogorovii]
MIYERNDVDAQAIAEDEHPLRPDRRAFLAALAATSAGVLAGGVPGLAEAASNRGSLQRQVVELVTSMRRQGLLQPNEKTSWSVYDFTARKKIVSINEGVPRQAASMIKPLVAQAYFFQMDGKRGQVRYTDEVRKSMERMLQRSSNPDTNKIMDLVSEHQSRRGPADVELVLKQRAPAVFRETRIVEKIPTTGQTYRNQASAHDYSRFLISVWDGRMPNSKEMLRMMGLPSGNRLSKGVAGLPETARVYNKTGSTAMLCGDMGVIEIPDRRGRNRAYTVVGIIERPSRAENYGAWIRSRGDVIRRVSNLIYQDMRDRYRLV